MTSAPVLTIVVPCYNEQAVLPEAADRLGSVLATLVAGGHISPQSKVLLVDDGSKDRTWAIIAELCRSGPFAGVKLSRNRGHQNALLAGLERAEGDLIVSIDADLQDDVNAIGRMVQAAANGADIVFGVRENRQSDTWFKRTSAEGYYRVLESLGVEVVHNHADYRLLTRRALDALFEYDETNLFLRGIIPRLGFSTAVVGYARAERFAGESKYPLRKMLSLALEGITSFSVRPLRWISLLGGLVSLLAFLFGIWAVGTTMLGNSLPGWASTVIPVYFISGIQLLSLGVIGEYLGKIYMEVKRRPRFHVENTLNLPTRLPR